MNDHLERDIRQETEALFERLPPIETLLTAEMAEALALEQPPAGTITLKPPAAKRNARVWLIAAAVIALLFISLPAALRLLGPPRDVSTSETVVSLEPPRQGMIQNPANGHFYEVVTLSGSLEMANTEAKAMLFRGSEGHIVTITSEQEDNFVRKAFTEKFESGPGGPYLGGFQPEGSVEPGGGWQWLTGEPFDFTDWVEGEPNDSFGEDCVEHIEWPEPGWNDIPCPESGDATYIIEYDVEP